MFYFMFVVTAKIMFKTRITFGSINVAIIFFLKQCVFNLVVIRVLIQSRLRHRTYVRSLTRTRTYMLLHRRLHTHVHTSVAILNVCRRGEVCANFILGVIIKVTMQL